jgi:serine/threonine protein kinase
MSDLIGHSLGRYHILEKLGEGGMAVVYKAYDTRLDIQVAVKIIRMENITFGALDRTLKRFEREAKALARLTHPNIVKVTDYGEYEGKPYLVMPLLSGGNLKNRLNGKPMPWQDAMQTLIPIADALGYAHKHDIIHRDVKPANILITENGQLMLADFGVAKMLDFEETTELTGTGVGIGTPEYMAPEQGSSKTIDHRADIYSLGVVFYEMLTGRKPYTADTPLAVLIKRASEPLPRPKLFVANLPQAVENIVLKALAKDPKDRYQTMGEFAKALEGMSPEKAGVKKIAVPKPKVVVPPKPKEVSIPKPRAEFKFPAFSRKAAIIVGVILLGTGLVAMALSEMKSMPAALFPTKATSQTPLPEATPIPSVTPIPVFTSTLLFTATATSLPDEIVDAKGVSMRLVPAGEFTMGADEFSYPTPIAQKAETNLYFYYYDIFKPIHQVYLDAYYMDKYEVTNAFYKACVEAGACTKPESTIFYDDPNFSNHPVVYVNWGAAKAYCEWRGARLPTEAEWEKAARGNDGRMYPWGNGDPAGKANFSTWRTTEVGSFKDGVSPYGLYDMAGNVFEWVNDWYSETYYKNSPVSNPTGPGSGQERVVRSGGPDSSQNSIRVFFRSARDPIEIGPYGRFLGFRCTWSIKP